MHHRQLLARVAVADVGGDVVSLRHRPAVLGAGLFIGGDRGRAHRCIIARSEPSLKRGGRSSAPDAAPHPQGRSTETLEAVHCGSNLVETIRWRSWSASWWGWLFWPRPGRLYACVGPS